MTSGSPAWPTLNISWVVRTASSSSLTISRWISINRSAASTSKYWIRTAFEHAELLADGLPARGVGLLGKLGPAQAELAGRHELPLDECTDVVARRRLALDREAVRPSACDSENEPI